MSCRDPHATGVPVPYDKDGRRLWPGLDPGPEGETPDRPRPAYRVDGETRHVAEMAVFRWEEIAHTWEPAAARALWERPECRAERARMYEDCGRDPAIVRRMAVAKRLVLDRCAGRVPWAIDET